MGVTSLGTMSALSEVYVVVLEKKVELTLVPSESQQNNRVLQLTTQADDSFGVVVSLARLPVVESS